MISVSIKADIKDVTRGLNRAQRQAIPTAAQQALNRTVRTVRTKATREISKDTSIKQKEVRGRLRIRNASKGRLKASLTADRYTPNLGEFAARQGRHGVIAKAWGQRRAYRGTFLTPRHKAVKRLGRARFPLEPVFGPNLRGAFLEKRIVRLMRKTASERFRIEFERSLKNQLRRFNRRS